MMIQKRTLWLRPLTLGVLCACLGFSYALATSVGQPGGPAHSRDVVLGSNCNRPPVQFVSASNLGLVVMGSEFMRQIQVKLGFTPHHFFFGTQSPSGGITLSDSGLLSGASAAAGVQQFEIRVRDDTNNAIPNVPVAQTFTLTTVGAAYNPGLPLQFVSASALPVAVQDESYAFTFQLNGGSPPYLLTFLSDQDFVNVPAGLALNPQTGDFIGKPVTATPPGQPAQFTLVLSDTIGSRVTERFTLQVLPGTINTTLLGSSGGFDLRFGKSGGKFGSGKLGDGPDSLKLNMLLNKSQMAQAGIRTASDLAGLAFSFSIGGSGNLPNTSKLTTSSTGTSTTSPISTLFDKNGMSHFPDQFNSKPPIPGYKSAYKVKLNPETGVLNVSFDNVALINAIGAEFSTFSSNPIIPIHFTLSTPASTTGTTTQTTNTVVFDTTESIQFLYRRGGANAKGTTRYSPLTATGGAFFISKFHAKEVKKGLSVDNLIVDINGFMRQSGGQPINLDNADQLQLMFGDFCVANFSASTLTNSGGKLILVNPDPSIGLHTLIIDNNKGKITIETNPVVAGDIFSADVLAAGTPFTMTVTLSITQKGAPNSFIFDGQSSITVFRKGSNVMNK